MERLEGMAQSRLNSGQIWSVDPVLLLWAGRISPTVPKIRRQRGGGDQQVGQTEAAGGRARAVLPEQRRRSHEQNLAIAGRMLVTRIMRSLVAPAPEV